MSKGILLFARNNERYDYAKIAALAAKMARRHLSGFDEICLVTDTQTYESQKELLDESYDRIIEHNDNSRASVRVYNDSYHERINATFKNLDRSNAYNLSPYDETLVIDCDYLIMSNQLDNVWGIKSEFAINYRFDDINQQSSDIVYLEGKTIPMCWATVIYFRKTPYAKAVFDMVNHIRNNYEYYCMLYKAKSGLYRNDFVFSIALHIISGSINKVVDELPIDRLTHSFDTDDVFKFHSPEDVVMICTEKRRKSRTRGRKQEPQKSKATLTRLKNTDVHIMNKQALMRNSDILLDMLKVDNE